MKIPAQISILGSPESVTWEGAFENPRFKKTTKTQSIIFDKNLWTVDRSREWLRAHGKKSPKVDSTEDYHRFRQESPDEFQKSTFRTISLGRADRGIKAIIAVPKSIKNPTPFSTSFRSREFFLACNETLTILYLIDGQYASEVDKPKGLSKCRAFKLWSGFSPDTYYQFDLPQYTLKKGGAAIQICYQSDKWDGKLTHYFHDFVHGCDVWINKTKDATLWAIKRRDGKKIVSAEGIIG